MNLEIENLEVYYGKIKALKGISVSVKQGEIVTLIGANGAGKTTTLKTISGLRGVSSGKITFDGQDISSLSVHARVELGISLGQVHALTLRQLPQAHQRSCGQQSA